MNQMQVAFIRLHNTLVDRLRDDGADEAEVFEQARRSATWHYQHVILREFLPLLIGAELAAELLEGGAAAVRPRTASRTSRSSSPTPRTGTATRRSATLPGERGFGPCPCSPT